MQGPFSSRQEVIAEVSGQMQTTSLSVLVNADKRASFRILRIGFSPLAAGRLSHQSPSCHTILPLPPPSRRPPLDLVLDRPFGRIWGPLDSPHLSWFLLFFLTLVGLCFTSPPGRGVEAGRVIHRLISGSCGGPWGQKMSSSGSAGRHASPPGQLWFPLSYPGDGLVCLVGFGGGNQC